MEGCIDSGGVGAQQGGGAVRCVGGGGKVCEDGGYRRAYRGTGVHSRP